MPTLAQPFQLSQETRENRFPKVFLLAKKLYPSPKTILSFGCSTGMECFTLSNYFPQSYILGYDICKWSIGHAIRERDRRELPAHLGPPALCSDPGVPPPSLGQEHTGRNVYFTSTLKSDAKFDLVFALMVFFSIENPLGREQFDAAVAELSERVNPGGLIVLRSLEFPFSAPGFSKVKQWRHGNNRNPNHEYYAGAYRRESTTPTL